MDIHSALTDINRIIDRLNFRELDGLKRKAFLEPILKDLQAKAYKAGRDEALRDNIKHLTKQLQQ